MIVVENLPLWLNALLFAASAAGVWLAGTRLSYYADAIARRTGIGHAVVGMLLLGGITSLPEISVAGSASLSGDAALAVNNLLGGFAMQVAILAIADLTFRGNALTAVVPDPIVLLQGSLGIVLVALVVAGIGVGDTAFLGAGLWTWIVFFAAIYSVRMITISQNQPAWQVVGQPPAPSLGKDVPEVERSGKQLVVGTCVAAGAIVLAGYILSTSGEALAHQTGLGSSFFGAVFVAISTSLPEISTVLAAVRLGRYVMAVSDIFGTNLFDIGVIFLVDLLYSGGPVLNQVGDFSMVAGALGIIVTAIYVVGLIERRDPAVFGVGLDSLLVAAFYVAGIALLFGLR